MQVVAERIDEFDAKLICQIMVGLAHLGPPADARLLAAVIKRSTDLLETFSPQVTTVHGTPVDISTAPHLPPASPETALLCWIPCHVGSSGTCGSL